MIPPVRKFALTAHVTASVGWLGSVGAFLVLAIAGLRSGDAEILHLHSVARFLSPAAIAKLAGMGKPVVWTLHDHRPFTGGCHFPGACSKYATNCNECPQLGWDPYFVPEAQLADALAMIPARRITFVSPTEFLAKKARASGTESIIPTTCSS